MYVAQNIKDKNLYLVSPDSIEELMTPDIENAHRWKTIVACRVWCAGCGGGEWKPLEIKNTHEL